MTFDHAKITIHRECGKSTLETVPEAVLRADQQAGFVVVMEGTPANQIRAVALQGDAHPLGQALQRDFRFQAIDLIVEDSSRFA